MDINEIIGRARRARSLMTRDELLFLCDLAEAAPDGTGVEIGVYCGASLIAWSLVREGRGLAVGVDNWAYIDRNNPGLYVGNLKEVCEENLRNAGATARLIDGDSVEIAKTFPEDLAFVFIDGDHESPGVDNDISYWTPKLLRGGVVAFHDYGRRKHNFAVTRAVDEWVAKVQWKIIGRSDTTIGFKRP
jgi:hypothetical protein